MLIVKVDKGIDQALKKFKFKFAKTKVKDKLRENQQFTKKSVKQRKQKLKATYKQGLNNDND